MGIESSHPGSPEAGLGSENRVLIYKRIKRVFRRNSPEAREYGRVCESERGQLAAMQETHPICF
jgi:hypothetical protein